MTDPQDFLTVEEAGSVLRFSRGKAYELAREYLATGITDTLGRRPSSGEAARTWDRIAGLLAQHQTAFGIAHGTGPQPRWDLDNAYSHSHDRLTEAIAIVRPARMPQIEIELPGIEL